MRTSEAVATPARPSCPRSVATSRATRATRPHRPRAWQVTFALVAALLGAVLPVRPAAAQQLAERAPGGGRSPRVEARPASHAPGLAPSPALTPDEVVCIVLEALARTDDAAPELEVVFAFASPANRAALGTIERFTDLVRDDAYRPLLGHRAAVRGAMKLAGDRATQRVVVTTAAGNRVAYTISLSRQTDGTHRGCWMTDGVTREPPSSLIAPRAAE